MKNINHRSIVDGRVCSIFLETHIERERKKNENDFQTVGMTFKLKGGFSMRNKLSPGCRKKNLKNINKHKFTIKNKPLQYNSQLQSKKYQQFILSIYNIHTINS